MSPPGVLWNVEVGALVGSPGLGKIGSAGTRNGAEPIPGTAPPLQRRKPVIRQRHISSPASLHIFLGNVMDENAGIWYCTVAPFRSV